MDAPVPGDDFLALTPEALLRQCTLSAFRGSGPGGQKRNKTSNGIRLTHRPTGLSGKATESRSQALNRRRALERLRLRLALELRRPVARESYRPSAALSPLLRGRPLSPGWRRQADYPRVVQEILDLLTAHDGVLSETAQTLGTNTARLVQLFGDDGSVLEAVNTLRRQRNLKALR